MTSHRQYAELEIGSSRMDDSRFQAELRFSAPNRESEVPPLRREDLNPKLRQELADARAEAGR